MLGFLESGVVGLIDDLHEFHSDHIDPKDLCVSMSFFNLVASEEALQRHLT